MTLAFSGERWGSSGDQRLHTVHIEHAGEMRGPTERPCPLGSPLSGLVRTRVCNPRPFGRQAIWAKDPSGAVSFQAAYVYDLFVGMLDILLSHVLNPGGVAGAPPGAAA